MASPRTIAKLEARIHERAAHCIEFELADPRGGMITLTGVKLSSDLSIANIRFTVLGGKSERVKAEHMLQSAAGFIQRQVARVLDMRKTPALRFHYDESLEEAIRLDDVIHKALERDRVIQEAGQAPPEPVDDEDAGEAVEEP
ncbi:MAG TPA: 30S ribosome-binding factor RbfA [Planctomycetota bacterium]|nr:30S ribosome-binding factor RbfA [Planctomycetota bacterium]